MQICSNVFNRSWAAVMVAAAGMIATGTALADDPFVIEWQADIITADYDWIVDVAVDNAGHVYGGGYLTKPLGSGPDEFNAGHYDGVLIKYDSSGNKLWHRYLQTSQRDRVEAVAVDTNGNVYVAGYTAGDLAGFNKGADDFFIARYDGDGNRIWIRQFGSLYLDHMTAITTDSEGNVYATGYTRDGLHPCKCETDLIIVKYDPDGNQVWFKQHGTDKFDNGRDILVAPDGFIYVGGDTRGDFGGQSSPTGSYNHAMISKFDSNGDLVWANIFGSQEQDLVWGIARSADNKIYAAGVTNGRINGEIFYSIKENDGFLARFDADTGATVWINQIDPVMYDTSEGMTDVVVDSQGRVIVTGYITGTYFGTPTGMRDAVLAVYNDQGVLQASQLLGTPSLYTDPFGFAIDNSDALYMCGTVGTPNNAWIKKLSSPTDCLGDIADDFGLTVSEGGGPDGFVDFGDFAALLGLIGPCDGGVSGCLGDIADDFGLTAGEGGGPDGVVDFGDFAALLGLVGPCP